MSNSNTGQIPTVTEISSRPDEEEELKQFDPQYADEMGKLGSTTETGSDEAEIDTAELAEEVGLHTKGDQVNGMNPLDDAEDIEENSEEE